MSNLQRDLGDVLFEKLSLYLYERIQAKERKNIQHKKEQFIKNNVVVVTINGEVFYDSSKDGEISDDLYIALLSYDADQDINIKNQNRKNKKKKKEKLIYNLNPNITSIIA